MKRLTALFDWLLALVLVFAGFAGIVIVVCDLYGYYATEKAVPHIILGVLGLLAISVGLERMLHFRRIHAQLESPH